MAVPCDAPSLVAGAACYDCAIPKGMQATVIIYLLCQIAKNSEPAPILITPIMIFDGVDQVYWSFAGDEPTQWYQYSSVDGDYWEVDNIEPGNYYGPEDAIRGVYYRVQGTDGAGNPVTPFSPTLLAE